MGIAAYNRGSEHLSRQISEQYKTPSNEELIRERLNNLPKNPQAKELFGESAIVRYDERGKEWWLMNKKEDGWESWGMRVPSLSYLAKNFQVYFLGVGQDNHSFYWELITSKGLKETS